MHTPRNVSRRILELDASFCPPTASSLSSRSFQFACKRPGGLAIEHVAAEKVAETPPGLIPSPELPSVCAASAARAEHVGSAHARAG